jgi:hypothetical protein
VITVRDSSEESENYVDDSRAPVDAATAHVEEIFAVSDFPRVPLIAYRGRFDLPYQQYLHRQIVRAYRLSDF